MKISTLAFSILLFMSQGGATARNLRQSQRKLKPEAGNIKDIAYWEQLLDLESMQEVIKDIIISSIKHGDIYATDMKRANEVGFRPQEVKVLVDLAQKHGDEKEIEKYLDSVYFVPKDATQDSFHHIEIISREDIEKKEEEDDAIDMESLHEQVDMEVIQKVIKDAIISSIKSDDYEIDPVKLVRAKRVGFTLAEVKQLVDLAKNHGDEKEIEQYLNSVYFVPKDATQYNLHHVEVIQREDFEAKGPIEKSLNEKEGEISVPRAIANALLSSLNLEVDPAAMDQAEEVGFSRRQVRHLVHLAQKKIESDGGPNQVEKDLKKFREMKFPRSKSQGKKADLQTLTEMSPDQHRALSEVISSASTSPTNDIDPNMMEKALEEGVFSTVMARMFLYYKFSDGDI